MQQVLHYFLYQTRKTIFLVGAGLLFALTLGSFIDANLVDSLKQNINMPLQIFYAELIGFISPGPRYILYPLLATLHEYGIGTGVIIALISGHVLIEPSTFFVEIGFFGYRFPLKRFFIALFVTFLAGLLTTFLID
ncbi:MAG: hypothetical protein DWQ10_00285 [Calditrichaeota bacterium]|nr:MAG: hypothetical protein DWQ10_00285 [Calditrichota bacterium]